MKRPTRRELALQKKIVAAITKMGGVARIRAQTSYTKVGDPDVYGCYNGHHFEFEVKEPDNFATKVQIKRIIEWRMAGATSGVVYTVDDATGVLIRATGGTR